MMRSRGARAGALLLLFTGALGGCAGSLFKTQLAPPTLYLLSPAAPPEGGMGDAAAAAAVAAQSPASPLRVDLAVLKPRVRPGLDNDRIAVLYPDRRLDYFADARWSGPLDEVIQDLAVRLFHSRAGAANVSGDGSAFVSPYWLEIEVADFQAEYAGGPAAGAPPTVRVHLLGRIGSSGDRRVIARFDAAASQQAAANRLGAIVDAYSRAANRALLQIAADSDAALAPESKQR